MNTFFKSILRLMSISLLCALGLSQLQAAEQKKQLVTRKKTGALVGLKDEEVKSLVLELYEEAEREKYVSTLPEDFAIVGNALRNNLTVSRDLLDKALVSLGEALDVARSRAPRPEADPSVEPVGPGCCCDLTQVERLLAIIRSRIGTTDDDVCDQTVLGILGNACEILGFNISTALKMILDLIEVDTHCATVLKPEDILPNGYTITSAGYYILCGSVGFDAPGTSTCVIRISASNVTLDMNDHTIYQTDADANLTGVCIDTDLDNIVIKNGKISGMTAMGINAASGSQDIVISNMTVRGCGTGGINFTGTLGSPNKDLLIENSSFTNNSSTGGTFVFTDKIRLSKTKFNDNTNVGASITFGSSHDIEDCSFCNNTGSGAAIGLDFTQSSSSIIRNCVFNGNTSSATTAQGLNVTSTGNYIEYCFANGNRSTAAATAIGFDVTGTAHTLSGCYASGNASSSSTGTGFRIGSAAFRCLVRNSTSITNSSRGFQHDAPAGLNLFVGNFSFGHGSNTSNYNGSGLGFISVGAGAQPPTGSFDERAIDNISVI